MRISDWSSDVCSSDLVVACAGQSSRTSTPSSVATAVVTRSIFAVIVRACAGRTLASNSSRSEEHTSELQSLMRISYAVFCLKKKKNKEDHNTEVSPLEQYQEQTIEN